MTLSERHLFWASCHLTEGVCWVSVPSTPTGSATCSPPPKTSQPAFRASFDTHRSVSLDHTAVRKICEMPPREQHHPFAWEMHWSSVTCSWSLPELCCRSALPGHVPCWTWPNSLAWISGMTSGLPHFCGLVWRSLTTWLTLVTVTRPALAQVLWDWALVGEDTAPAHLAASLAPACPLLLLNKKQLSVSKLAVMSPTAVLGELHTGASMYLTKHRLNKDLKQWGVFNLMLESGLLFPNYCVTSSIIAIFIKCHIPYTYETSCGLGSYHIFINNKY